MFVEFDFEVKIQSLAKNNSDWSSEMHLTQLIEFEQKQVYSSMFSTSHTKISTVYEVYKHSGAA